MPEAPAAPAAAPAAPAPAPAPAAPAARPAQQPAAPVSKPAENIEDAYSQLDAMAGTPPEPPPAPPKPGPKEDETPPAPPTPAEAGKPQKAGTLRENYDRLKGEFATLQAKMKTLETDRAKAQDPKEHPEFKKVTETLTAREQRLQELEDEMRFTKYERSSEYKDQYEKPFLDTYGNGRNKIASLTVMDPATGEERQGHAQDFDAIMRIQDDGDAAQAAFEMFGNKASIVMYHREKVQEANNRRVGALEDYRTKGGEREKQRGEQAQKAQKEMDTIWESENKTALERFPKWFAPEDGDAKGNALLERGFALADAAFGAPLKDPATGEAKRLTGPELVKLHSAVRNKAAAFDRLAYKHSESQKRIKELEAKVSEYEGSEPGAGDATGKRKENLSVDQQVERDLMKYAH